MADPNGKITLEERIRRSIRRRRAAVYVRADFEGDYDQVGRALARLVRKGELVKIGQGLYAKAAPSPLDGRPVPVKGVRALGVEAMRRLGVKTRETRSETAYRTGKSTQVPAGRVVAVDRRVRRNIAFNGQKLSFERA